MPMLCLCYKVLCDLEISLNYQAVGLCTQISRVVKNMSLNLEVNERLLEIESAYSCVQ